MNLDTTSKTLQIVLGEAMTTNDCDIVTSWADFAASTYAFGNTNSLSNGTSVVTVVASPLAAFQRQVKEVRLFNNDTVAHTVTLQLFDGASTWIIAPSGESVDPGGSFVYTPESGVCCTSGGGTSLTVEDDTGDTVASVGVLQFLGVKVSGSTPSAITNMTTITGAVQVGTIAATGLLMTAGAGDPASSTALGADVGFYGGAGGAGTVSTQGGDLTFEGGAGGSGATSATGGGVTLRGGDGGFGSASGQAGSVNLTGGRGYGTGFGGGVALRGGNSYGVGNAGAVGVYSGYGLGSGSGGRLKFRAGASYGAGAPGEFSAYSGNAYGSGVAGADLKLASGLGSPRGKIDFNNDPSIIACTYSWVSGALLNNQTIFTTTRPMVITAVIGRPDAANGSAATLVIVKAASGTAPSGGTALTSTSMDLNGTANTNQTLALSVTVADITLAAGDSLCMVTTGALTLSAGCITIWGTPQ